MALLTHLAVQKQLQTLADGRRASNFQRFFKTGPGQYGEGDRFIGLTVPQMRTTAKTFVGLPLAQVVKLLRSPIHEHRLTALMIMVLQFQKGDETTRRAIYDLYLSNTRWVNNWDLVDASAPYIVGAWLEKRSHAALMKLARSPVLWERRIAIVATQHLIRKGIFATTFDLAERLMADPHDLIHKAVGWMLREVYKRDPASTVAFLEKHQHELPRTALRYAIERCDGPTRKRLMERPFGVPASARM